jgi:hypothetical protein
MSTKTENKEVVEIEILTPEQIESLSKTVKENVVFLTENMNVKDIAVLNPMVSELLKLKDEASALKMLPVNEEGEYDKDNIQEYTTLKVKLGKCNASIKAAGKKMKENPAKKQKAIIAIEKDFLNQVTELQTTIQTEFKTYLDELEKDKAAKLKAKEDALNAEIIKANSQKDEVLNNAKKTEIYNTIKFTLIGEQITEKVNGLIVSANEQSLKNELEILDNTGWDNTVGELDYSVLENEVLAELRTKLATSVYNATLLIEDKLNSIKNEKDLMISKSKEQVDPVANLEETAKMVEHHFPSSSVPAPPSMNVVQAVKSVDEDMTDEEFVNYIKLQTTKLRKLVNNRIGSAPAPVLKTLVDYVNQCYDYVINNFKL